MKFPLSWLQEYIDVNLSPNALAKTLTMAGLEVESVEKVSPGFSGVIVAKVLEVEKHPNADKLCIATVTDGTDKHVVVCGASNCRPGIKTALALAGATVLDEEGKPFKIKKGKIRGVESNGMLCAADELGLGKHSEGIIEFAEHMKEGADLAEMYSDVVFEVAITPNLGHCSCLLGIAQELSAATGAPVKRPMVDVKEIESHSTHGKLKVKIDDTAACPRYAARVIENVKVGPSPEWLQKRLTLSGIRPINNVVDITNYVFLEQGQPLHAFDYDRIGGQIITVRKAHQGEKFVTLDNKERELTSEMLMICDEKHPIALAGVMGGLESEVVDNTTTVALESAYFNPVSIRRTSKKLGLTSDASKRFERNADPNRVPIALDRAATLIAELAGGKVCQGMIDQKYGEFHQKAIDCRLSRINELLGTKLGVGEVETLFHSLGFHTRWDGKDSFHVRIPTDRADITIEVDLVGEVARFLTPEQIPNTASRYHTSTLPHAPIFLFERKVRSQLVGNGLQEFLTCDLIGPKLLSVVKEDPSPTSTMVKILNPNSEEQSILRESLLPGMLDVVKYNFDHDNPDIHGFEIGRIHFKAEEGYKEQSVAGIALMGNAAPSYWDPKAREVDFYDLKGIVENLLAGLGIEGCIFKPSNFEIFHPGRQAAIYAGDIRVGSLGEIHPIVQKRLDVPQRIYFAELNLHDLFPLRKPEHRMEALPLYPCTTRDWTLTLDDSINFEQVLNIIRSKKSQLLEEVSLLDIYRNEKLGQNKKNVTLHFVYRDKAKTLSQEAADAEHARLIAAAAQSLGVPVPGA